MYVTIMVTAVLEVRCGMENLWKSGNLAGMKTYFNYGLYIPLDYFKAFLHELPYLWAEKKYRSIPQRGLPFNVFIPFVDKYNIKRKNMLHVLYLMLDESMSGW